MVICITDGSKLSSQSGIQDEVLKSTFLNSIFNINEENPYNGSALNVYSSLKWNSEFLAVYLDKSRSHTTHLVVLSLLL